ncbi:MAG TPA: zinc-binding dehydrogenase [Baekduia sp.]|jgi:threonine dehydrogenase-like Zn-dependent dehydrogenase
MRAAVLDEELIVREWEAPEPGPGEALVALTKVGICGSDVHFVIDGTARTRFKPIILGHEPAGRVEALGPGTEGPPPGTRVAIVPLVSCMKCDRCLAGRTVICRESECLGAERHGCWADLIAIPVRNLVPLPDNVSDELGAVSTDAVATAFHAVRTRGGVTDGSRVAIWGTGGLGLCAVGIARALGAKHIVAIDPREESRAWALETGADEALHPDDALAQITGAGGVDVSFEFIGRPETVELAVRSLDDGGRAVSVGIGTGKVSASHLMTFVVRERSLVGAYGSEPSEVAEVIDLMSTGKLKLPRLIGDTIKLEDIREGVERVHAGRTGGSRIIVDIEA